MLPRLWGNDKLRPKKNGTLAENGTGKFSDIDNSTLEYLKWLGCSHVWYTGVLRHSTQASEEGCIPSHPQFVKGKAGSPYAICDYYDVNAYLADNPEDRMLEFESLIKRSHDAGLNVIIDFVPNHVSRDYGKINHSAGHPVLGAEDDKTVHWKSENDFFYYPGQALTLPTPVPQGMESYVEIPAMATGNNCYSPSPGINDWYETVKINYGDCHTATWDKMWDIIDFWSGKGVDGFRCDMVELVPPEFFKWLIETAKQKYPKLIFIAEVYKKELYSEYIRAVGFDYLYDKVGMYDYLRGVTSKNWPVEGITNQWMQHSGDRLNHMLYFLENHDEQRIASGFFCGNGSCAEPAMIIAATLNQCPVMIYMGQELGERGMDMEGFSGIDGRTTIFDYWGVKSIQAWANKGKYDGALLSEEQRELHTFYQRLLTLARDNQAIQNGLMYDITYAQGEGFNKHEQFAFLRHKNEETLLIIANFHDREQKMHVRIPNDAFVYLGIDEKQKTIATDLLRGEQYPIQFIANEPIELTLPAWRGVVLKID
jgi:glycosidase